MPGCKECRSEMTYALYSKGDPRNGWYCRCGRGPVHPEWATEAQAEAIAAELLRDETKEVCHD